MSSGLFEGQKRAAAAALLLASNTIAAPVDREPVRVSYRAPEGCPNEARFWGEVAARTDRVRRAEGAEPARSFSVLVEAGATGSRGVLESTDVNGVTSRRDVTGEGCAEVVSALALITALTVDTQARTDATVSVPAASAEVAPIPAPPVVPTTPPVVSAPVPPPPMVVPPDRPAAAEPRDEGAPMDLRWSTGAQGQALGGLTPNWALGAGAFVELFVRSSPAFSPSFRLTPWFATAHALFENNLGADITWYVVRLEACPITRWLLQSLRFDACLGMDGGVMYTTGLGVEHPDSQSNGWFAPLLAGRFLWRVADGVRLDYSVGGMVPLRRYPFVFTPAGSTGPEQFHRLAAAGAFFALGVAYEFP